MPLPEGPDLSPPRAEPGNFQMYMKVLEHGAVPVEAGGLPEAP